MLPSLRFMLSWLAPTRDALFVPSLSWSYRWRLLVLQPIALLTYVLKYLPYVFSRRYSVIGIPTRGKHVLRAIVFKPPGNPSTTARPLHIDFHGGAFIGGMAEYDAPFCELLSDRAGAVVISAQYRYAPAYMYPCAHEDAEDVVDWVLKNVGRWNADPDSLTVSGSSAGGDLMFAAGTRARAAVGFCPVVDLRIAPWQKPKPASFDRTDPLSWLMPLFDAYAGGTDSLQLQRKYDARLSPILKPRTELPSRILFVVAGIDILAHDELSFIERLKRESSTNDVGAHRVFQAVVFEQAFHGWLELPAIIIGKQGVHDRDTAYNEALKFLIDAHKM